MAAPWEAGRQSERRTAKEVCEISAAIGQGLAGTGPDTDRNPEGARNEGGACVGGPTATGAA